MVCSVVEGSGLGSVPVEIGLTNFNMFSFNWNWTGIGPRPSLRGNASILQIEDTHVKQLGLKWFTINITFSAIYGVWLV